jgi:hypothetical protein
VGPEEQDSAARDLVDYALRAGYQIEIYDLFICVDDATRRLVLSPAASPVTFDSPRRKAHLPPDQR